MQLPHIVWQAAARAKQAEVPTQPDAGDPLGSQYGDAKLVRSESVSGRTWTPVDALTPELKDQKVSSIHFVGLPVRLHQRRHVAC
jgi:hypothetical protein